MNKLSQGVLSLPPTGDFSEIRHEFKDENREMKLREIARLEARIIQFKGLLSDVIYNSANEARKKQNMTYQEVEAENQDIGVDQISDDEDDDQEPNIKNKKPPQDSDGRPIPFWLYKLHGLGIEFK